MSPPCKCSFRKLYAVCEPRRDSAGLTPILCCISNLASVLHGNGVTAACMLFKTWALHEVTFQHLLFLKRALEQLLKKEENELISSAGG